MKKSSAPPASFARQPGGTSANTPPGGAGNSLNVLCRDWMGPISTFLRDNRLRLLSSEYVEGFFSRKNIYTSALMKTNLLCAMNVGLLKMSSRLLFAFD